jgi:Flp pilus assembly protein TadG
MALLTPTLLLIFVAIVDFGLALYAYDGAVSATREAAKFGANGANNTSTTQLFTNSFNIVNHGDTTYTDLWIIRFQTDSTGAIPPSGTGAYSATNTINGCLASVCTAKPSADAPITETTLEGYLTANNANATGTANIKWVVVQVYYEHPLIFGWFGPRLAISAWSMQRDVTP